MFKDDDGLLSRRAVLAALARAGTAAPFALSSAAALAAQAPRAPSNVKIVGPAEVSGTKAVLQRKDLKFLGFLRFPTSAGDLWYAEGVLALRRVGGETRVFANGNRTANSPLLEFRLPDTPNPDLASAPTGTLLRTWGSVMAGRTITGGSGDHYTGGLYWDAARNAVWWSYGDGYVPVQSHPTLGCTVLNDSDGTWTSYGPWRTEWNSQRTRGAFCPVPSDFSAAYTGGKSVGIMASQASGVGGSPFGAILSAMTLPDPFSTPADVATNAHWTVANHGIILHDLDHRQARDTRYKHCGWVSSAYDCKAGNVNEPGVPLWGGPDPASSNDTMSSMVWVDLPDKHGLLYFGQLATTPEGYTAPGDPDGLIHQGYGNAFNYTSPSHLPNMCCHDQDDPWWGTTGPFAHARVPMGWIYNPNDLIATAKGQADLWSRRPTDEFQWRSRVPVLNMRYPSGMFGGAVFDPTTRRIYVMLGGHDTVTAPPNARPVMIVFEVT